MTKPQALLLAVAAAAPAAHAFWRMECRGVGGYYRMDPLVNPGAVSSHVHSILGSGGFSENATYNDITSSSCTSCMVTQDKSAYWHPALYFMNAATNTFQLVEQVGGTLAYYLLNAGNGSPKITAFPAGFRMIAGDNERRSFTAGNVEMVDPPKSNWAALNQTTQDSLAQRAVGFNCLDYSKTPEGTLYRHFLPDKTYLDANCPDGVRFELMFPSCWNGKDVDSPNHKDHVAYPDLVMEGDCPPDFPVRLPSLFYETIWNTAGFPNTPGQFVIANGDVQGFAYHGDFMMGWDPDFLQNAVDTCTNPSGLIQDCPLFTIQSLEEATSCKISPPANLVSENTTGPGLTSLPGDRTVFGTLINAAMIPVYDPDQAAPKALTGVQGDYGVGNVQAQVLKSATIAIPTPAASPSSTSVAAAPAPPAATTAAPPPPPPPPPAAADAKAVSTQYVTNGNVVTEILWEEDLTTVYVSDSATTTTTTVTIQPTPGALRIRHAHNHMRRHNRAFNHGHGHAR